MFSWFVFAVCFFPPRVLHQKNETWYLMVIRTTTGEGKLVESLNTHCMIFISQVQHLLAQTGTHSVKLGHPNHIYNWHKNHVMICLHVSAALDVALTKGAVVFPIIYRK